MQLEKVSHLKQRILIASIAIILVLFVAYGINTFYESPKYEDFCNVTITKEVTTPEICKEQNGSWESYQSPSPVKLEEQSPGACVSTGYCNLYYYCQKEFDKSREAYNKVVFIVSLIAGIIAIILGGFILSLESVSSGILGGGVLTVIYGTIVYWEHLKDVFRFLILGIVLAVLIWIGYKKFKK